MYTALFVRIKYN